MPEFGHESVIFPSIEKRLRERWKELISQPLPKITGGYLSAYQVARGLKMAKIFPRDFINNEWLNKMELEGDPKAQLKKAVSGRFFTLPIATSGEDEDVKYEQAENLRKELNALGCDVIVNSHVHTYGDGSGANQMHLFLPHMKVIKSEAEHTEFDTDRKRDIDGAAIMLAYLLKNNLVTEAEVLEQDSKDPDFGAFSPIILARAKSPEIQAKFAAPGSTTPTSSQSL